MRVAYFVHDLTDPAVAKRTGMLIAAGADMVVLGFRRDDKAVGKIHNAEMVDFGRTYDGNFVQRMSMTVRRRLDIGAWGDTLRNVDVFLARNLETLILAGAARRKYAPRARLVYETLDIHRLLFSDRLIGKCMRWIERRLLRQANLLLVSSPAFVTRYFEPKQGLNRDVRLPVFLIENKAPRPTANQNDVDSDPLSDPPPGPPWRIGWYGMIRCRKSLDMLCDLTRRRPQLLEIVIRGRPARTEFDDFDAQVAAPSISFGGPYRPSELGTLYRSVHFSWAVDYFEEGANSSWLLPNRLYEGGSHDAVPIAAANVETGRFLKNLGIGVVLDSPLDELEEFLQHLTQAHFEVLKSASRRAPRSAFVADDNDAMRLLCALAGRPLSADRAA